MDFPRFSLILREFPRFSEIFRDFPRFQDTRKTSGSCKALASLLTSGSCQTLVNSKGLTFDAFTRKSLHSTFLPEKLLLPDVKVVTQIGYYFYSWSPGVEVVANFGLLLLFLGPRIRSSSQSGLLLLHLGEATFRVKTSNVGSSE